VPKPNPRLRRRGGSISLPVNGNGSAGKRIVLRGEVADPSNPPPGCYSPSPVLVRCRPLQGRDAVLRSYAWDSVSLPPREELELVGVPAEV